ncbi:MAG: hypothetical protein C4562_02590 [Actinobacteria bacterium]|nr:MAG: hypothetical protein C4562_02590 [Actinomycetota bacterium]
MKKNNRAIAKGITSQKLELAVNKLVGVEKASVQLDGCIKEIHLLIEDGTKPESIVKKIRTLLFVEFNIKLDERTLILVAKR